MQTEFWRGNFLGNGHLVNWEKDGRIPLCFCSMMFVTTLISLPGAKEEDE
jgi:hypothetical protein